MWVLYLDLNVVSHSPMYVSVVVGVDISPWYTTTVSVHGTGFGTSAIKIFSDICLLADVKQNQSKQKNIRGRNIL